MTKILITGASGMVGQHVAQAARTRGHEVVLADISWSQDTKWPDYGKRVTFDVSNAASCFEHVRDVSAIVHCAAIVGPVRARNDAMKTLVVNVNGTANLLHAAQAVGARLLNVSTATLYGHRPGLEPLSEDSSVDPLTVYDGTKLMSEVYCTSHRRTYKSDVASFRTGFVYGYGSQIGEYFLPKVLAGESVVENAGVDHPCDFTYVVDLAEALVCATTVEKLSWSVYNVTGGVLRTRGELAAAVRKVVPSAQIEQGPGIDTGRHLRGVCEINRAKQDLDWKPRFSLESGIEDWHRRLREVAK